MPRGVVEVHGAKELARAFRSLGKEVPRAVRQETKELVERVVIPKARQRGLQRRSNLKGNPTRFGSRGVATIRPDVRPTTIAVVMGGPRAPYAAGHEWGAKRYRQFPPSSRDGYILYPTVKEEAERFAREYEQLLDTLIERYLSEAA